jgi:3',5'-cyclic-AMP phosphodiesterase
MNDLTFVHLSDLHIGNPNQKDDHLWSDTTQTLEHVKSLIATLEPQPAFIVISGDLTNNGQVEEFHELKRLLADIQLPVLLSLGNHDTQEKFYEIVLEQPERGNARYHYSQDFEVQDGASLRVIVLDSSAPIKVHGTINPEQFEWLERELEADPEMPKLMIVHHPPTAMHLPIFEHINFDAADAAKLQAMLKGKNVIGVLSGHVHYDQISIRHGVPYFISTGLHNMTDVLESDGIRAVTGTSFNWCYLRNGDLNVVKVPLPSDQTEVHRIDLETVRRYMAEREAKALVSDAEPMSAAPGVPDDQPDDLQRIEGIGPKISDALGVARIDTFAKLEQASEDELKAALEHSGLRFAPSLGTWAEQAGFLVRGDEEGFKALTDRLVAGRVEDSDDHADTSETEAVASA